MEKILFNISNHPSFEWMDEQKKGWDLIVDIPFPNISPNLSADDVEQLGKNLLQQIVDKMEKIGIEASTQIFLMLEGEYFLTFKLSQILLESKMNFIFAFPVTERIIHEDGRRDFRFSGWRLFPSIREKSPAKKFFFLAGMQQDWSAMRLTIKYYGRKLTPAEMERNGIRVECHCHYPCANQLGVGGRFSYTLYSLGTQSEAECIMVTLNEPTLTGREGYDVSLLDPWDADPQKNWKKEITSTEVVCFEPNMPKPCQSCPYFKNFVCHCDDLWEEEQ